MTPHQRQQLINAIALVAQGGMSAERGFRIVYDEFWGRFVARFLGKGMPHGVSEDLASDAMVKIASSLKDLRDPIALERWANVVARNVLFDHLRAHHREHACTVAVDDEAQTTLTEQLVDHSQGDVGTQRCLEHQLVKFCSEEPMRSNLISGVALEGWSIEEAAQIIGRTPGATKEYLSQSRKRLWR